MRDEIEGAEDQEEYYYYSSDQFHSLPDEVLHLILSKLSDPKSLLRSSLVSDRFASILSNFSSLSLQIPSPILPTNHLNLPSSNPNHHHLSTRLLRFLTIPFRFLHHFVPPPSDLHSDDALLFTLSKLLQRFHNVRSLRVEFPCSCHSNVKFGYSTSPHHHDSTSFKWKAKLGLKIDTFTILLPTSLCKINEETDREEEEESEAPVLDWLNRGHGKAFWPMYYAFSMHRLLLLLIVKHPRLRSVVITDSKKQGRLALEGEELVALRNLLVLSPKMLESVESIVVPQHVKLWYVPELKLPLSGCVMKKVTLMAFKGVFNNPVGGGGGDEDDDDADVRAGGFEDDENGIFEEAVMEILSNSKDSLKLFL